MYFDNDLEMYVIEIEGVIFLFEDELEEGIEKDLKSVAEKYWDNLDFIIEFMMPDLRKIYGDIDNEMVKYNLGRPTIDWNNGRVDYCEQSFDDCHVFRFEFLDEEFKDLQYFSIDG